MPNTQNLPTHVAKMAAAINAVDDPRLQIWASFELTEMLLRWIFAVAVADLVKGDGQLPDKVAKQIRDRINQPTMGNWRQYCEVTSKAVLEDKGSPLYEIAQLFLDSNLAKGSIWADIIEVRNDFVHGGAVTQRRAEKLVEQVKRKLFPFVEKLNHAHGELKVWARFNQKVVLLTSAVETEQAPPRELPGGQGTWIGNDQRGYLSLRPLMVYEPIFETWELGPVDLEFDPSRKLVSQSYFKVVDNQIYYTPIGVDDFISINPNIDSFEKIFPRGPLQTFETILDEQISAYRQRQRGAFYGRENEIRTIQEWYRENTGKIGFIKGDAGFGKSALVGRISELIYDDQLRSKKEMRNLCLVYHAFNAEDPHNDRRNFLLNFYEQVTLFSGRNLGKDRKYRRYSISELQVLIVDMIRQISEKSIPSRVLVIIDGFDEIMQLDPKFGILINDELRLTIVTMIVASRPSAMLDAFDSAIMVSPIMFGDQDILPGMTDRDIRIMLLERLDKHGREILKFDVDAENGELTNPYIAKVVRHANGAPIYIDLLISDIEAGHSQIDPDVNLPSKLEEYYLKILSREGITDTKAHIAILVCLLAISKEPLTEENIADFFSMMPGVSIGSSQSLRWAKLAIAESKIFTGSILSSEGAEAYYLYHQKLKEFINPEGTDRQFPLNWALGFAKWLIVQASLSDDVFLRPETRQHVLRHGAEYVLAWAKNLTPKILNSEDPYEYTSQVLSQRSYLKNVLGAWDENGEDFLHWYMRVFNLLAQSVENEVQQKLIKELLFYIVEDQYNHAIDARVVQSSYAYVSDAMAIYKYMFELITAGEMDEAFTESHQEIEKIAWYSDAGGRLRRLGDLEQARSFFDLSLDFVNKLGDQRVEKVQKILGLLHYEIGYLHNCAGEHEDCLSNLGISARYCGQANDVIGRIIAESAAGAISLRNKRAATAKETKDETKKHEMLVERNLVQLLDIVKNTDNDSIRLSAERWVMNCRAQLFDAAFYRNDIEAAKIAFEAFIEDPWMQNEVFQKGFNYSDARRAQLALLSGDNQSANNIYKQICPIVIDESSPETRKENHAMDYLDYGRSLIRLGEIESAIVVLESGLFMDDNFANKIWKPQLLSTLASIT